MSYFQRERFLVLLHDRVLNGHEFTFIESICSTAPISVLQWRHNGCDGVSNHQPQDCLLNHLFRDRSKKTSKLRATGLCQRNSPVTGEFPAQRASNAENVSIWWRHHSRQINTLSSGYLYRLHLNYRFQTPNVIQHGNVINTKWYNFGKPLLVLEVDKGVNTHYSCMFFLYFGMDQTSHIMLLLFTNIWHLFHICKCILIFGSVNMQRHRYNIVTSSEIWTA